MTRPIRAAHCDDGTSNKVYVVGITKDGDGTFNVVAAWGKLSAKLPDTKVYHSGVVSLEFADSLAADIFGKKTRKKYIDVESGVYVGTTKPKGKYSLKQATEEFKNTTEGRGLVDFYGNTDSPDESIPVSGKTKKTKAPFQTEKQFYIPEGVEVLVVIRDVDGKDGGMDIRDGFDLDEECVAVASPLGDKYVSILDRFGISISVPQQQVKFLEAVTA
jgi:hypothetical protein